jgi:hypothetical protein
MNEQNAPAGELTDKQIYTLHDKSRLSILAFARAIITAHRALRPAAGDVAIDEDVSQPWYDIAWKAGATSNNSLAGDELESITFATCDFEAFCFELIATLTAERNALRKDAERWAAWRDSLAEQSKDYKKQPELFRLLENLPDATYGPRTPAQIESDTDKAIAAMTKEKNEQ